jgi:DNA-binding MarR family transcriptional regulator
MIERLHRLLLVSSRMNSTARAVRGSTAFKRCSSTTWGDDELTAGELKTRGYYLGSNVSYNLKKLVEMGYLHYKRSDKDRRSVRVSLTPKGVEARETIQKLYQRQLTSVEASARSRSTTSRAEQGLVRLERFWTDQIRYRL